MQGIEELAHAKVNLFLRVLRRREDGFHEIETFMAPITLCDSLELESANAFEFRCDEPGLAGDDNLVVRAARLFFSETNRAPKVRLTLRKEIPHGAGLGGGSSDAAAALRGLNRFFDAGLSSEKLMTLAAQLGSDVSFFVNETAATCSGRGEIVTPAALPVPLMFAAAEIRIRGAELHGPIHVGRRRAKLRQQSISRKKSAISILSTIWNAQFSRNLFFSRS